MHLFVCVTERNKKRTSERIDGRPSRLPVTAMSLLEAGVSHVAIYCGLDLWLMFSAAAVTLYGFLLKKHCVQSSTHCHKTIMSSLANHRRVHGYDGRALLRLNAFRLTRKKNLI